MATILDFGKNKGKILADCEESYLKWLVSHDKVLAKRNRWAARDAKFILERRAAEAERAIKATEQIVRAETVKDWGLVGNLNGNRAFSILR